MDMLLDANARWRMLATVTKGRALSPQGEVNWSTMMNNIKRSYPKYYNQSQGAPNEATARAIRAVRAGEYFKDSVGDSGTATRMAGLMKTTVASPGLLLSRAMMSGPARAAAARQMVARGSAIGPARGAGNSGEALAELASTLPNGATSRALLAASMGVGRP